MRTLIFYSLIAITVWMLAWNGNIAKVLHFVFWNLASLLP